MKAAMTPRSASDGPPVEEDGALTVPDILKERAHETFGGFGLDPVRLAFDKR
jgi:hypothetical protein